MQPYTPEFARTKLTPQDEEVEINGYRYRPEIGGKEAWVHENGPDGEKRYRLLHALGGKNIYYFLTPMERGKLQVLPIAYNVRTKMWFDTTTSMVRHFVEGTDEAIHWTERPLTFNVSCYGCHVSQIASNYNFETDTYETTWNEPGINCETCHEPGAEHIRICTQNQPDKLPDDLKMKVINRANGYTAHQVNSQCAPCHAKMYPISDSFRPGDEYFNHFGLVTYEHQDFYPDGRDLGENYTFTSWRMSPCLKSGELDCIHCHTSSGRYRFNDPENANGACLPCHKERVENVTEHTHHKADSEGNRCIACHMPMTEFALMRRSDHSMRPPMPAATIAFKSPNACNICHDDKDAQWADKYVREWRERDYQAPVLHIGSLIAAGRKRDWSRLDEMLAYIVSKDRKEIFATSMIRLLETCDSNRKWSALVKALDDPSPLVRAAAATALEPNPIPEVRDALLRATKDEYRLVRVRAAASLASYPREALKPPDREALKKASDEYVESLSCRPDEWSMHYNLANFYADRGRPMQALEEFVVSARLDPTRVPPLVNASMVHARLGQNEQAEAYLRKALGIDPKSAEANFNLGLLMAEKGNTEEAEQYLRKAIKVDPRMAQAAYNLAVLVADRDLDEAVAWCRKATAARPNDARYAYTLAFYLQKSGKTDEAIEVLRNVLSNDPPDVQIYMFLASLYEQQGRTSRVRRVFEQAVANKNLSERDRQQIYMRLQMLQQR